MRWDRNPIRDEKGCAIRGKEGRTRKHQPTRGAVVFGIERESQRPGGSCDHLNSMFTAVNVNFAVVRGSFWYSTSQFMSELIDGVTQKGRERDALQ